MRRHRLEFQVQTSKSEGKRISIGFSKDEISRQKVLGLP